MKSEKSIYNYILLIICFGFVSCDENNQNRTFYSFDDIVLDFCDSNESIRNVNIITGYINASISIDNENELNELNSMLDLKYISFNNVKNKDIYYNGHLDMARAHTINFFSSLNNFISV